MKFLPSARALAILLPAAALLRAAPLTSTTAIQSRPDPSAPVIGYLKAGTEPAPVAAAPDGWVAVSVAGPFDAYVPDKDFTKDLDVIPGTPLYALPAVDSGVIATAGKGDKIEITGLHGKWTRVRLNQPLVGYVQVGPSPAAPVTAPPPQAATAAPPNNEPGHPAPGASNAAAPHYFEGRFVSTRRMFAPRRPFPWELVTVGGARIAYLDVGRLLQTEQIDSYVGRTVLVFGTARPVAGTKDIVVEVDSLWLR